MRQLVRLSLAAASSLIATTLSAQSAPMAGFDAFVAQAQRDF